MDKQMIEAQKGFTLNENERLQMATLLIKAGYSVRITRIKQDGKSSICIEYWK